MADPVSTTQWAVQGTGQGDAGPAPVKGADRKASSTFGAMLRNLIAEADGLQRASEQTVKDFAAGKVDDVHEVMLALTRADLSFRMVLEVRNKLVEAYQEIMRLNV